MNFKTLGVRVLVAVIAIPMLVLIILKGQLVFVALVATIVVLSQLEFYNITEQKVTYPLKILGLVAGVAIGVSFYYYGPSSLWIVLTAFIIVFLIVELFRNQVGPTLNVATTFEGVLYPALLLNFLILLRQLPNQVAMSYDRGGWWIVSMFLCVWICDTAAYFVGASIGRYKLFERVSPNKTVEGAVAGFIFALLTMFVAHKTLIPEIGVWHCLAIGFICGTFGQISDLVESLFKRDVKIKDSSNILPGHGGILDRFDSIIFVAPLMYFYLRLVVF
ncbi:MAG: phosphatidate cytidylyltransferase [candidate division KSB1 bacterium]|nr:phosphatidate cytidylyltransferase [candidate division KSB1 bacterium]